MNQLFPPSPDNRLPGPDSATTVVHAEPQHDTSDEASDEATTDTATAVMLAVGHEQREPRADRPWVYTNMIVAADGATAVGGLSGDLGGEGDRMMFRALRAQADIILVGAGTARAEGYRPPQRYEAAQTQRIGRGQQPRPRLALVTGSLNLDPEMELFDDSGPDERPFVISSTRSLAEKGAAVSDRADTIAAGDSDVNLRSALTQFKQRGFNRVLCEGGPSLNGQLIAEGLIDEWNLTIAPLLIGGDSKRAAVGPLPGGPPPGMKLNRVWLHDNYLFCRWTRP